MTYYLYKKTHRKTGLKYLGKTKRDPYEYQGSGKWWTSHIAKHGYDVETEILLETEDHTEITRLGIYYSNLWNVVASNEWANLKVEQGDGGWDHMSSKLTSKDYSQRGKIGRKAQDEYFIKNFGSVAAGRRAVANTSKQIESYKRRYANDPILRAKNQKSIKAAGKLALSQQSREKRKNTLKNINHQQGEKNSQFGTCWITNDVENKKIKKEEIDHYLQLGYRKGRISGNKKNKS